MNRFIKWFLNLLAYYALGIICCLIWGTNPMNFLMGYIAGITIDYLMYKYKSTNNGIDD